MKKMFALMLTLALCLSLFPLQAKATAMSKTYTLQNGDSMTITGSFTEGAGAVNYLDKSVTKYILASEDTEVTFDVKHDDTMAIFVHYRYTQHSIYNQGIPGFDYVGTAYIVKEGISVSTFDGMYYLELTPFVLNAPNYDNCAFMIQMGDNKNESDATENVYIVKAPGPIETKTATPTASKVTVDDKAIAFDAYNIAGNNYFKLRDVAKALKGSGKQFEIQWDQSIGAINMLSGKSYTSVGGELIAGATTKQTATTSTAKLYLNGEEIILIAYTINGNNYFKLRDLGKTFDFGVGWNAATNTISIDTSTGYTE